MSYSPMAGQCGIVLTPMPTAAGAEKRPFGQFDCVWNAQKSGWRPLRLARADGLSCRFARNATPALEGGLLKSFTNGPLVKNCRSTLNCEGSYPNTAELVSNTPFRISNRNTLGKADDVCQCENRTSQP